MFGKLIGLALVLIGIYFLGQNIIFTTKISPYWYQDISAGSSVIAILLGIMSLVFLDRESGVIGWFLIGLGIALVFVSGRVILKPTSLWYLFVSFSSLTAGLQIMRGGRL